MYHKILGNIPKFTHPPTGAYRRTLGVVPRPMLGGRRIIRNGDPVIVYGGVNSLDIIYVEENKTYDGRHGHYFHNSLIGLEYGSKVCDSTVH